MIFRIAVASDDGYFCLYNDNFSYTTEFKLCYSKINEICKEKRLNENKFIGNFWLKSVNVRGLSLSFVILN